MNDLPDGFVLDAAPPPPVQAAPPPVSSSPPGGDPGPMVITAHPSGFELPDGFVLDSPAAAKPAGTGPGVPGNGEGVVPAVSAAQPAANVPSFDDPNSPLYHQRYGGSVATGLIDAIGNAFTLPGDVATGKVEPTSDEGVGRAFEMAALFSPQAPGPLTTQGTLGVPREQQKSWIPGGAQQADAGNPVVEAANRLGVPIPTGVATDSRTRQAITQAARQMPFGGGRIEQAVDNSLSALSGAADTAAQQAARVAPGETAPGTEAVGNSLRTELQRAVNQRNALAERDAAAVQANAPAAPLASAASIGDDLRAAFANRVSQNEVAQDQGYATLRRAINPNQPVVVSQDIAGTLQHILDARAAAAEHGLPKELTPALDIATNPNGVTFNGLQRARNSLGKRIDFEERNGGFNVGDLKQGYAALTEAMHTAVAQSARGDQRAALDLFRRAEDQFGRLAEQNRDLTTVAAGGSEALVNRMIGYASDMTKGNVARLQELQAHIPQESRAALSRLAFQRLGSDATGAFSLERFAQQWGQLSPQGRAALFGDRVGRIEQTLRSAMSTASATREANADIIRLLGSSDEGLARRVLAMATTGASADHAMLARLASVIGPEGMRNLASLAIQNLGANRAGEFSPAFFTKNWQTMSEAGKAILFPDAGLRSSLNDIATVSARMAEVERKFANKSNTGRAGVLGGLVTLALHDPTALIGGIVGGQVLGRILSKPATAASMSKWATAYERMVSQPSAGAVAAFDRATGNLANTVGSSVGAPLTREAILQEVKRLSASSPNHRTTH